MLEQDRDNSGQFGLKGKEPRKFRTIRLTDTAWEGLRERAEEEDMSRADLIEALIAGDISWDNEESDSSSDYDFDVEEVIEILKDHAKIKASAAGKLKVAVKKAIEMMGGELDDD